LCPRLFSRCFDGLWVQSTLLFLCPLSLIEDASGFYVVVWYCFGFHGFSSGEVFDISTPLFSFFWSGGLLVLTPLRPDEFGNRTTLLFPFGSGRAQVSSPDHRFCSVRACLPPSAPRQFVLFLTGISLSFLLYSPSFRVEKGRNPNFNFLDTRNRICVSSLALSKTYFTFCVSHGRTLRRGLYGVRRFFAFRISVVPPLASSWISFPAIPPFTLRSLWSPLRRAQPF